MWGLSRHPATGAGACKRQSKKIDKLLLNERRKVRSHLQGSAHKNTHQKHLGRSVVQRSPGVNANLAHVDPVNIPRIFHFHTVSVELPSDARS